MPSNKCMFCSSTGTQLCDSTIAWLGLKQWNKARSRKKIDVNKHYTCDALLCRQCAKVTMNIHFTDGTRDTGDLCPFCVEREGVERPLGEHPWTICTMTEEVATLRRQHNARLRRWILKRQKPIAGGGQLTLGV